MINRWDLRLLLLVPVFASCTPERPKDETTLSPGPVILEATEVLRLGEVDGEGPAVFSAIRDFLISDVGDLYVLDYIAQEIRVFTRDGSFLHTIGRKGKGPGEFEGANGLSWGPEGNLWINDPDNHRVSVLTPSGDFLTSHPRSVTSWGYDWPGGVDGAGRIIDATNVISAPINRDPGVHANPSRMFVRSDPISGTVDTLVIPPDGGRFYRIPFAVIGIPFDGGEWLALGLNGDIWTAHTREYRITRIAFSGDTVQTIVQRPEPIPVSRQEREAAIGDIIERMKERGPVVDLDYSIIPETKPEMIQFFPDDRGGLWVRPTLVDESVAFDVFDSAGAKVAVVRTTTEIGVYPRPRVSGGRLYGVVRDDLGVNFLVVLRFELPPGL